MINPETFKEMTLVVASIYLNVAMVIIALIWATALLAIMFKGIDPMLSRKIARILLRAFIVSGLFFLGAGGAYLGISFDYLLLIVAIVILAPIYVIGEKIINNLYETVN